MALSESGTGVTKVTMQVLLGILLNLLAVGLLFSAQRSVLAAGLVVSCVGIVMLLHGTSAAWHQTKQGVNLCLHLTVYFFCACVFLTLALSLLGSL